MSRKIITSYPPKLSARGAKRDTRWALPAEVLLWPSDDGDDDDCDDDDCDDDDCDDDDDDDCDVDRFDREKGEDTLEESQARSFSYCINLNHTF